MARFTGSAAPVAPNAPVFGGRANATTPRSHPTKVNRYAAKCVDCGVRVEAEQGTLTKNDDTNQWEVRHVEPCPEQVDADVEPVTEQVAAPINFHVPDGTYTVVFENGDYRTLRVRTQDEFASFKPGVTLLDFLSGSNNERDYTGFAEVEANGNVKPWRRFADNVELREAVRVLVGDPRAAAAAYGIESEHCGMCGRKLSTPESLARGIGPDCAAKAGW